MVKLRLCCKILLEIITVITVNSMFLFFQQGWCAEQQARENLISGGDCEQVFVTGDNLWDGVDSRARLKVIANSAPCVADINGDGKKDIVCGDRDWMLWCYINSGTNEAPQFTLAKFIKNRFEANVKPTPTDWDGNGKADIILGTDTGQVYYLKNTSFGNKLDFSSPVSIEEGGEALNIGQLSAPAVADWDGDSKKDLILGEGTYSANSVYVYLNSGSNSSPDFAKDSRQYLAYGDGLMNLVPSVVDWDKDGDLDLIVGDENGYINLYLNSGLSLEEKKQRLDKKEVKTLNYTGRIKAEGSDMDMGSYATPFVTDWDEDGDWDIVCGDSNGYIRLILNQGTAQSPSFSQPTCLTGEDTYKTMPVPGYWSADTNRNGAWYIMADDQDPYAGKYSLKVFTYDGCEGQVVVSGSIRKSLERDKKYKLIFYAKGKDAAGTWQIGCGAVVDNVEKDGRREQIVIEQAWSESDDLSLGSSWEQVSSTFRLPKMPKDLDEKTRQKVGEKKACSFTITIKGKGPVWLDEFSLEQD